MASKRNVSESGLPSLALVFGYIAIKELGSIEDRVSVLSRLGYGNIEMAKICGTTSGTIKTIKSAIKSKKKGKK